MTEGYKGAGVNIDEMNEAVSRIKSLVRSTVTEGVLTDIGGFGGMFAFDGSGFKEPVLVASTDGVGTKLKVAVAAGVHNTVGVDLVCHCVNDIAVHGARPLFFLDYIATGKLRKEVVESVVEGLAAGCRETGCALLGGETAEMPGMYRDEDYDLAGTVVGVVEKSRIVSGSSIVPKDVILGLESNGLHTNGYSLVRKICFEKLGLKTSDRVEEFGSTLGEELLRTHRSYERSLRAPLDMGLIKGLAHITGGGFIDNIPRVLPEGTRAVIEKASYGTPPIFRFLKEHGGLEDEDMYRTFNMGVGMIAIVSRGVEDQVSDLISRSGTAVHRIGEIAEGPGRDVVLK